MVKINNAKLGTFEYLHFRDDGTKKKLWNEKYTDELVIKCIKESYILNISCTKIDEKYNLPKGTDFNYIYQQKIYWIVNVINGKLRPILNWRTAKEVFLNNFR